MNNCSSNKRINKVSRPFSLVEALKTSKAVLFLRVISERAHSILVETKYLANGNRYSNARKLKTDLQMRVHAIEKGMSIGHLKEGFGNQKACLIIDDLRLYDSLGGDKSFTEECCGVLCQYVRFKNSVGQKVDDVDSKLNAFIEESGCNPKEQGGIYQLNYREIYEKSQGMYPDVVSSRYAVRDFGSTPINMDMLRKALQIAEKTPSACNRQSWRVHVYSKDKASKIFQMQKGGVGFISNMQVAILICGDLQSYFLGEQNLLYVDGGLYGMNLMLALHYCGLACIPLTMGHKAGYIKKMKREMGLPENEMPVLLIGVGSYKNEFKAAVSYRYPYSQYTDFEE